MKWNGELLLLLIKGHFNTLKHLGDDLKMMQTREGKLASYFLTDRGSLPWQWQHIRSTGPGLATA